MKKITKEEILNLSNNIGINIDDKLLNKMLNEFNNSLLSELEQIQRIDISQLEPTDFGSELSFNTLRDDEYHKYDADEILLNSENKNNKYIKIKK